MWQYEMTLKRTEYIDQFQHLKLHENQFQILRELRAKSLKASLEAQNQHRLVNTSQENACELIIMRPHYKKIKNKLVVNYIQCH